MRSRLALCLAALAVVGFGCRPNPAPETEAWSAAVNGLQARLVIVEKPRKYGTRWLVPFLELRNVRDGASPMAIQCDNGHLKIELVDAAGKVVRDGNSIRRSGPVPEVGTVALPVDSFIRISLECTNWGITQNAAAMVSTDSGAWVLADSENGKVYLRATLTGEKGEPEWKTWYGKLQTPPLVVKWD